MAIKFDPPLAALIRRRQNQRAGRLFCGAFFLAFAVAGCGSKKSNADEATVDELNRAYKTWAMTRGGYPTNLYDLTNHPALQGKRLPSLPPGKKLMLDGTARQIVVVDQ